jgi:hypothetical protein
MVIMLRECCCGCSLKTGAVIIGVLDIVSANFPSTLLTVYRNGSSLFQEQKTIIQIKEIIVHSCRWIIGNKHSNNVLTIYCNTVHCLNSPRWETWLSKKNTIIFMYTSVQWMETRCRCLRYAWSVGVLRVTYTVNEGEWSFNKSACIFKIMSFMLQTDKRVKNKNYEVFFIL